MTILGLHLIDEFTWNEFIAPLEPTLLLMAFVLGLFLGYLLNRLGHHFIKTHVYWMVMGGAVFFIPLALLRAMQGSTSWERFLATFVIWLIFSLGMRLGSSVNGKA